MADWKNKPNQENTDLKYRDYGIDNTPGDFSNFSEHSDPDLKTIFNDSRKRELYIYPLNNLIKNSNKINLYFSANVTKIGFIDLDEVKKVTGYEASDFILQLDARNPTNIQDNTVEYTMVDAKTILFQDATLIGKFKLHVVSIGEPANQNNLDQLYLINSYNERYASEEMTVTKEMILVRIKDFKVRGSNPIVVFINKQLPEDTKVKSIRITYPRQTLFGNIKAIGEIDGVEGYSKLFLEDNKVALPMLAMPIEIEPKVRILQQWMSTQILPWKLAKNFFVDKSCLPIFRIEKGKIPAETVIKNVVITKLFLQYEKNTSINLDNYCIPTGSKIETIELTDTKNLKLKGSGVPMCSPEYEISLLKTKTDITIKNDDVIGIDSLNKVLLKMLDYTYNYRTNFKHAKYYDKKDDGILYGLPKNEVAKLKENIFTGQKPEVVITNLFEDWKFENPNYINHSSVNIFKQVIMMLSEYLLCDLSINGGQNDDYKILLPYYFELVSKPILEDGVFVFKDVRVKLKSEYFHFDSKNNIFAKNNDISQNELFRLNENQFNWLPLINNLEVSDIPSLLPKDIKLSDGNYCKNYVYSIISKLNLNHCMNLYGKGKNALWSNFRWIKEINEFDKSNYCKFILEEKLDKFKKLEISAIFGFGKYDFEIEMEKNIIKINNIALFNEKNSSYAVLEI